MSDEFTELDNPSLSNQMFRLSDYINYNRKLNLTHTLFLFSSSEIVSCHQFVSWWQITFIPITTKLFFLS